VVFKLGFADSRRQARQIVTHGHIKVNKRKVTIPSCQVKKGDIIEIREESKKKTSFVNLAKVIAQRKPPSWLKLDAKKLTGEVASYPISKEMEQSINTSLIVEFYSR
jgi:small subunit ribosomal protein S4